MNEIYVKGKRIRLDPSASKGKGGEADIFGIGQLYNDGRQIVAKVFKGADHPDYLLPDGKPNIHEQQGAIARLKVHQTKLRRFPQNLPSQIIRPIDLATDKSGNTIAGYTMDFVDGYDLLVQYRERSFRQAGGIGPDKICNLFKDIHAAIQGIHAAGVVIGDCNDLNWLVAPSHNNVKMIDADSMQFGGFPCRTFTQVFVDPALCIPNPNDSGPLLKGCFNPNSDWYAFLVMLMQSLLFLDGGPYGGVYKPKDKKNKIPHSDRWQRRITVFHPEVTYPRPSVPLHTLSDDLLHFMSETFVRDKREPFPVRFLDANWTVCSCGTVHARMSCLVCQVSIPVTEPIAIAGKVKATTVFSVPNNPDAVILYATFQDGDLKWLYHDGKAYRRENEEIVISGPLDHRMRFRICDQSTLIGKNNTLVSLRNGQVEDKVNVDSYGVLPVFDANASHRYWAAGGSLYKDKEVLGVKSPEVIGQILAEQTLFWTGSKFGFGFYRAGELSVAFVFDASISGIKDTVNVSLKGQLIDSTCVFSDGLCWFFSSSKIGSKIVNQCHVIKSDGSIIATTSADKGTEPWLDNLRGKMAAGNSLFVPTDDGILKYDIKNGRIELANEFPGTEKYVNAASFLFPGRNGIHVVSKNDIKLLQLA